jgi:hypothetical protein
MFRSLVSFGDPLLIFFTRFSRVPDRVRPHSLSPAAHENSRAPSPWRSPASPRPSLGRERAARLPRRAGPRVRPRRPESTSPGTRAIYARAPSGRGDAERPLPVARRNSRTPRSTT